MLKLRKLENNIIISISAVYVFKNRKYCGNVTPITADINSNIVKYDVRIFCIDEISKIEYVI